MPVSIEREEDGVYRLDVEGVLRKSELDEAQERLVSELRQSGTGSVRLLVVLRAFEGWEAGGAWNDLSFYVQHGDALARIAIVGAPEWRSHALMFAAADLRKGPVEYFPPEAVAEARSCLAE